MLNHIVAMGRLTRDPELRQTTSGVNVCSFTIACGRDFKTKDGKEAETDFIDCVAWRTTAEFVSRYLAKGRMAIVSGRLQLRDWKDRDGNNRRSAEVVADNVYFADSRRDGDDRGGSSYGAPSYGGSYGSGRPAAPAAPADYGVPSGGDQFAELADDDGDLPF